MSYCLGIDDNEKGPKQSGVLHCSRQEPSEAVRPITHPPSDTGLSPQLDGLGDARARARVMVTVLTCVVLMVTAL